MNKISRNRARPAEHNGLISLVDLCTRDWSAHNGRRRRNSLGCWGKQDPRHESAHDGEKAQGLAVHTTPKHLRAPRTT